MGNALSEVLEVHNHQYGTSERDETRLQSSMLMLSRIIIYYYKYRIVGNFGKILIWQIDDFAENSQI